MGFDVDELVFGFEFDEELAFGCTLAKRNQPASNRGSGEVGQVGGQAKRTHGGIQCSLSLTVLIRLHIYNHLSRPNQSKYVDKIA